MKRAIGMLMVARTAPIDPGFYRSLTLDQPASDLTDFPVLFTGTFTYLKTVANGGKVVNANGYDIRFFSDSALTTLLAFERVFWDATTGVVEFWVKVPSLTSASAKIIYLAYGNSGISSDQQNASGTWSNGFNAVYHLPNGTTLTANDSTSNANNGTLVNTPTAATGQIDGAASLVRSSNQYINIGNAASLQITSDLTIEAWINAATFNPEQIVAKDGSTGGRAYTFDISVAINRFYINGGGGGVIVAGTLLVAGTWFYVCGVYDSVAKTLDIYRNGATDATQVTGTAASINSATADALIGRRQFVANEDNFDGLIDEVRISNAVRSSTWIATCYSNQNDPGNFYIIGSETPA